eukprot:5890226-Ditylum_brightwellii.AAC.1
MNNNNANLLVWGAHDWPCGWQIGDVVIVRVHMMSMVGVIASITGGPQNGWGATWQNGRWGGMRQETTYGVDVMMN